jgi:hypothetical protein
MVKVTWRNLFIDHNFHREFLHGEEDHSFIQTLASPQKHQEFFSCDPKWFIITNYTPLI